MSVRDLGEMDRRLACSTVEGGLGVRPIGLADGRLQLELPLPPDRSSVLLAGPATGISPLHYALAVLCDAGLGVSAQVGRTEGDAGVTLDFRVDLVAEVLASTPRLVLRGQCSGDTPDHSAARAEVHDDDGRLIAYAAGTLAASPGFPATPLSAIEGERERLDLATAFDALVHRGDGSGCLRITPEMENMRGLVHGAVLAAAGLAAQRAQRGADDRFRLLWFAAEFLRPVPMTCGELGFRVTPTRTGRRFRGERTDLLRPDGRTAAKVTTLSVLAAEGTGVGPRN